MSACVNLISRIRNSTTLIVIIVFFSLLTDSMLLTLVDPILPDIIRNIDSSNNISVSSSESASDAINSNGKYGYLVAAKGATQFVCSPFVGFLVTRFGYRRPMLVGSLILAGSTMAFAFGDSYGFLFGTRMLQGAASSVTAVTGMGLLAATFTDDADRGNVMGIAIGGISVGIIAGPIYGSVLYQFFGQAVPFLALAGVILFTIALMLLGFKVDKGGKEHSMSAVFKLICDPYILVVATNVFLLNLDVSVVLAFLPLRLIDLTDPDTWQLGVVVLPTSIGYLIAGMLVPRTVKYIPRWSCALVGLVVSTASLITLAYCTDFSSMLIVTTFLGLALGMVSTSMQPLFAQIVDARHSGIYSNVYAISDMSVCLAMFVGPLIGGPIVYNFGFEVLVISIGILNLCFSQFSCVLRNIRSAEPIVQTLDDSENEKQPLITAKPSFRPSVSQSYRVPKETFQHQEILLVYQTQLSVPWHNHRQPKEGIDHSQLEELPLSERKLHVSTSIPTPRYPEYMSSIEDLRKSVRVSSLHDSM